MSCLIPLMEDQIELLRKQIKDAALSHDAQHAKIIALEAENAELRASREPQTLMMTAAEPVANTSVEDEPRQSKNKQR